MTQSFGPSKDQKCPPAPAERDNARRRRKPHPARPNSDSPAHRKCEKSGGIVARRLAAARRCRAANQWESVKIINAAKCRCCGQRAIVVRCPLCRLGASKAGSFKVFFISIVKSNKI
ncbi:hypothetical protein GWI33_004599 [Rhynchophorus ferrugineus]|uniref:Uncharacterized protein n=1 Tax=Rhynchophorus ferrugineus TaxID=354439 RepID=A0A834MJU2_RHYFE|nr:hypothetical protein GWI33_004599 [Rhynchophorus ferrugineus]